MVLTQFTRFTTCAIGILFFVLDVNSNHPLSLDTIRERLENRTFPSTFDAWGGLGWVHTYVEPGTVSDEEIVALADLQWTNMWGGVRWLPTPDGGVRQEGNINKANAFQHRVRKHNPNMVFLQSIRMRRANTGYFPVDSPYWVQDANGKPVKVGTGFFIDFTHPDVQNIIIQQAIKAAESGVYDGVFFDHWQERRAILHPYRTREAELEARRNIIQGIRDATHPDFLIIVNMNDRIDNVRENAHLINGGFLETSSQDGVGHYSKNRVFKIEEALRWAEQNMREPVVNCLEGRTPVSRWQADMPEVQRWMRLFTTMSLTMSNGLVLYAILPNHHHLWYDFWDANLGRPIGRTAQPYNKLRTCYIREYDNGWAVYSRSSITETITFDEVAVSVTTGNYDYIHEIPPYDGGIFLRSHPNPCETARLAHHVMGHAQN